MSDTLLVEIRRESLFTVISSCHKKTNLKLTKILASETYPFLIRHLNLYHVPMTTCVKFGILPEVKKSFRLATIDLMSNHVTGIHSRALW